MVYDLFWTGAFENSLPPPAVEKCYSLKQDLTEEPKDMEAACRREKQSDSPKDHARGDQVGRFDKYHRPETVEMLEWPPSHRRPGLTE